MVGQSPTGVQDRWRPNKKSLPQVVATIRLRLYCVLTSLRETADHAF